MELDPTPNFEVCCQREPGPIPAQAVWESMLCIYKARPFDRALHTL